MSSLSNNNFCGTSNPSGYKSLRLSDNDELKLADHSAGADAKTDLDGNPADIDSDDTELTGRKATGFSFADEALAVEEEAWRCSSAKYLSRHHRQFRSYS